MTVRMGGGEDEGMRPSLPPCTLKAIADPENLLRAACKARKGKRRRADVEAWWQGRESEVLRLSAALEAGAWRPAGYRFFEIRDPKRRTIAAAPFGDRVVHHALCNLMSPHLERRFIARSFSCQVGKGTTAARECCRELVNRHRLVLKCDVRKFFPSINHEVLMEKLRGIFRCAGMLELCRLIIDSHQTAAHEHPCGLPIGNLTSQIWGNFYLDDMDHFITENQMHGAYVRYTDDFLIFANDPKPLWALNAMIKDQLSVIRLELATPKSRMLACKEGVPFCGFRFITGGWPRILGTTKRRFEKRYQSLRQNAMFSKMTQAVFAWYQFSHEGNAEGLRRAWGRPR